jgi:hypothetical protein
MTAVVSVFNTSETDLGSLGQNGYGDVVQKYIYIYIYTGVTLTFCLDIGWQDHTYTRTRTHNMD